MAEFLTSFQFLDVVISFYSSQCKAIVGEIKQSMKAFSWEWLSRPSSTMPPKDKFIGMAEIVEKVAKSVEILQGCVEQSTEHITPTPRTILLRIFYQKISRLYSDRELPGGGW